MKDRPSIEDGLDRLRPEGPPPELRDRVLRAAARALDQAPAPDLWCRLWENRGLRLAWAACLVTLITGHVVVSVESLRRPSSAPRTASQQPPSGEELQAIAALPSIDAASLQRGYVASEPDRAAVPPGTSHRSTEDPS